MHGAATGAAPHPPPRDLAAEEQRQLEAALAASRVDAHTGTETSAVACDDGIARVSSCVVHRASRWRMCFALVTDDRGVKSVSIDECVCEIVVVVVVFFVCCCLFLFAAPSAIPTAVRVLPPTATPSAAPPVAASRAAAPAASAPSGAASRPAPGRSVSGQPFHKSGNERYAAQAATLRDAVRGCVLQKYRTFVSQPCFRIVYLRACVRACEVHLTCVYVCACLRACCLDCPARGSKAAATGDERRGVGAAAARRGISWGPGPWSSASRRRWSCYSRWRWRWRRRRQEEVCHHVGSE